MRNQLLEIGLSTNTELGHYELCKNEECGSSVKHHQNLISAETVKLSLLLLIFLE